MMIGNEGGVVDVVGLFDEDDCDDANKNFLIPFHEKGSDPSIEEIKDDRSVRINVKLVIFFISFLI